MCCVEDVMLAASDDDVFTVQSGSSSSARMCQVSFI